MERKEQPAATLMLAWSRCQTCRPRETSWLKAVLDQTSSSRCHPPRTQPRSPRPPLPTGVAPLCPVCSERRSNHSHYPGQGKEKQVYSNVNIIWEVRWMQNDWRGYEMAAPCGGMDTRRDVCLLPCSDKIDAVYSYPTIELRWPLSLSV